MTVLVVKQEIIKSISIPTTDIRPMILFDVDKLHDSFRQEVHCMLASHQQLSMITG